MGIPTINAVDAGKVSPTVPNLLPPPSQKRTSSAGFEMTTSAATNSQSIFIKGALGKNGSVRASLGSAQKTGSLGSTTTGSITAEYTQPLSASVTSTLRAKLDLTAGSSSTSVSSGAGVSVTYKLPLSPRTGVSLSADAGIDNGVAAAAVTLKADQNLGNGSEVNLSVTTGTNGVTSLSAGANVALNQQSALNLTASQEINGGFTAGAGVTINF